MFANKTRVLLVLSQDVLDQARVFAGRATTTFKLAVSLQIILRALIEEGLRRVDDPLVLANVEGQARAVRQIRSAARKTWRPEEPPAWTAGSAARAGRSRAAAAPDVRKRSARSRGETRRGGR